MTIAAWAAMSTAPGDDGAVKAGLARDAGEFGPRRDPHGERLRFGLDRFEHRPQPMVEGRLRELGFETGSEVVGHGGVSVKSALRPGR